MSRKDYTVPEDDLRGHLRQAEKVGAATEGNRRSAHVHNHQKSYDHLVCMYVSIAPTLILLLSSATHLYEILPSSHSRDTGLFVISVIFCRISSFPSPLS